MEELLAGFEPITVYLSVVLFVGALAVLRAFFWLRRSERVRKEQVLSRRLMDALRTSSPLDDPNRDAKERGLHSIETRFTVTKRLVLPLIVIVTLLFAAFPFLEKIPATLVSVVAAAVTVALGIAARPVVENAIAGLVISFSGPFRIGDTVKMDNFYGSIEDITMTHTTIKIWDWRRYVIPNSQMLQSKFLNYSLFDKFIWAYVEFWVAYDADLDEVRRIALEAAGQAPHYAGHEPPRFWVMDTTREAVLCWVAAWAATPADAWLLTHDVRSVLIPRFQEAGIRTHGYRIVDGTPAATPQKNTAPSP